MGIRRSLGLALPLAGFGAVLSGAIPGCGSDERVGASADAGDDLATGGSGGNGASGGSAGVGGAGGGGAGGSGGSTADAASDATSDALADALADASGDASDAASDGPSGLAPDFSLEDVNPNSSLYQTTVSPSDYLGRVSAWYFGHAT
jgi:hypothetical protein